MLRLLQEKLGLKFKDDITDDTLRTVLKCFPYALRHKGTLLGVTEMVHLFLNIIHSEGRYSVTVKNMDTGNLMTFAIPRYIHETLIVFIAIRNSMK
jgi:hypothetical protein